MKRLLIRGDDLGYSRGVNYGISDAVNAGLVASVGLMSNMPEAEHGLGLIKDQKICLGLHTNICTGRPLSDPKLIPSICKDDGEFKTSREYREAAKRNEDFVDLDEVIIEIEAQYKRFLKLTGRRPGYFEGHAVASPNFFRGLQIVAQKYNEPYLAMSTDGKPVTFRNTAVYSYLPKDFKAYQEDPFTAVEDAVKNAHEDDCDMMVFHPGYIDAYLMKTSSMTTPRIMETQMLCDPETKRWLSNSGVNLVTYDDLD